MMLDIVRLDRHCGSFADPVRDVIAPWADAHPSIPCSLRVHWAGGHHLAVRFRGGEAGSAPRDVSRFAADLRRWTAANPSAHRLGASEYLTISTQLAHAEGLHASAIPALRQNDAVTVFRQSEPPYLGSPGIAAIRVAFEERTLPLLLDLEEGTAAQAGKIDRLQLALVQVAAAYLDGGARNGYRSVRAHASNFLAGNPTLVARFDALYVSCRLKVLPRIEALLRSDLSDAGCDDALTVAIGEAGAALDTLWERSPDDILNAGTHGFRVEAQAEALPPGIARWLAPEVAFGSPMRRRALGRHRALINMLYAQCPILGLSPLARFACAYVAFRGLAELLMLDPGINPLDPAGS